MTTKSKYEQKSYQCFCQLQFSVDGVFRSNVIGVPPVEVEVVKAVRVVPKQGVRFNETSADTKLLPMLCKYFVSVNQGILTDGEGSVRLAPSTNSLDQLLLILQNIFHCLKNDLS